MKIFSGRSAYYLVLEGIIREHKFGAGSIFKCRRQIAVRMIYDSSLILELSIGLVCYLISSRRILLGI